MAAIGHPPEVRAHARALYMQGIPPSRIEGMIQVKRTTIGKWAERGQWMAIRDGKPPNNIQTRIITVRDDNGASERLRQEMAKILGDHTEQLSKVKKSPSLTHLAEVGAVLESFSRTAKTVHNWGSEPRAGLILVDDLAGMKRANCGPEPTPPPVQPTTESVPAALPEPQPTVNPEQIEPQQPAQSESSHNGAKV